MRTKILLDYNFFNMSFSELFYFKFSNDRKTYDMRFYTFQQILFAILVKIKVLIEISIYFLLLIYIILLVLVDRVLEHHHIEFLFW